MKFLATKNRAVRTPDGKFHRVHMGQICSAAVRRAFKTCDDYASLFSKYAPSHVERVIKEAEVFCNDYGFESEIGLAVYKGLFQAYNGDSKALRGMFTGQRTKAVRLISTIENEFGLERIRVMPFSAFDPLTDDDKTWNTAVPISKEIEQIIIARVVEIETSN